LENKVRDYDSRKEINNRNVKMVQVQLSDQIIKNKKLEDKITNIETELENSRNEIRASNRLHDALIAVQR